MKNLKSERKRTRMRTRMRKIYTEGSWLLYVFFTNLKSPEDEDEDEDEEEEDLHMDPATCDRSRPR